jgi:hypothetical protein
MLLLLEKWPTHILKGICARVDIGKHQNAAVIGAIDGSHVPVIVPVDEVVNHTNCRGYTSQNVLAICDFDMRFTFAVTGWPGSAHDTCILNHALTNFPSFPVPPKGNNGFMYYVSNSCIIMYLMLTFISIT